MNKNIILLLIFGAFVHIKAMTTTPTPIIIDFYNKTGYDLTVKALITGGRVFNLKKSTLDFPAFVDREDLNKLKGYEISYPISVVGLPVGLGVSIPADKLAHLAANFNTDRLRVTLENGLIGLKAKVGARGRAEAQTGETKPVEPIPEAEFEKG